MNRETFCEVSQEIHLGASKIHHKGFNPWLLGVTRVPEGKKTIKQEKLLESIQELICLHKFLSVRTSIIHGSRVTARKNLKANQSTTP